MVLYIRCRAGACFDGWRALMLGLTRKTDYALIALTHLARSTTPLASAREIADRYRVPLPLLVNILKTLSHDGLVESVRGARGGYRLALQPERITLKRLITAVEGPVRLVPCVGAADRAEAVGLCDLAPWCPVMSPVMKVHHRLAEFLDGVTLAEIADDTSSHNGYAWPRLLKEAVQS